MTNQTEELQLKYHTEKGLKKLYLAERDGLRRVLAELSARVHNGYDFNADPDSITALVGAVLRGERFPDEWSPDSPRWKHLPASKQVVPHAYCCAMDPATCDCVNPDHGTAWINRPRFSGEPYDPALVVIPPPTCPRCCREIQQVFVGSWKCDCLTGLSLEELDTKYPWDRRQVVTVARLQCLAESWRAQNGDYPESKRDCADELFALLKPEQNKD